MCKLFAQLTFPSTRRRCENLSELGRVHKAFPSGEGVKTCLKLGRVQ